MKTFDISCFANRSPIHHGPFELNLCSPSTPLILDKWIWSMKSIPYVVIKPSQQNNL